MLTESQIIDKIAEIEGGIAGIKNSYSAYANPDILSTAQLPCVLHYPPSFTSEPGGHYNRWTNTISIVSILLVLPRQDKGGKLKYLENAAMPFLSLWRTKFQDASIIKQLLALGSSTAKGFLVSGEYGAGGNLLTHNSIEYIGCVFRYEFKENC